MTIKAPENQTLEYIPLYPDVSGGDRIGAVARIDGSLTPIVANNIEYVRRLALGIIGRPVATDWTETINIIQTDILNIQEIIAGLDPTIVANLIELINIVNTLITYLQSPFANGVVPTGIKNEINQVFTGPEPYRDGTLRVLLNGLEVFNFTTDSALGMFTFVDYAPFPDDDIFMSYMKES